MIQNSTKVSKTALNKSAKIIKDINKMVKQEEKVQTRRMKHKNKKITQSTLQTSVPLKLDIIQSQAIQKDDLKHKNKNIISAAENVQNVNQNSISYQISILYATPKRLQQDRVQERFLNPMKRNNDSLSQFSPELNFTQLLQEKQRNLRRQATMIELVNFKSTQYTGKQSFGTENSDPIKKLQPNLNFSTKKSVKSISSIIKKSMSVVSVSKKEQKIKKTERKLEQIQEIGDLQDIAKQIQKLNKKNSFQVQNSAQDLSNFENSRSFISQNKNSSSFNSSHNSSMRTIACRRRVRSEYAFISSSNSTIRPDTDPVHCRKRSHMRNGMNYSLRRDNMRYPPKISTISFYDDKQLAVIQQSICDLKTQKISLLQVQDWVKFVCLILKLDKRTFNKIVRLFNKVIESSDPMQAIFYYAGACISIYSKMECQHIFDDQQKQFPQIPAHSEHRRLQIQSLHPILQIKQLRRAECQISETVNFQFQLYDSLMQETLNICQLWKKFLQANKNAIKTKSPQLFRIGTENNHERRNYLYLSYIMDVIQFIKELNLDETLVSGQNQKSNNSPDYTKKVSQSQQSPTTSSSIVQKQSKNLLLILLSIFVVVSNNFFQKYCSTNRDLLTDWMVLVSNFYKKLIIKDQRKILHLQYLMKKTKQMQIQNLFSRIELQELIKLEKKASHMKSKEQISTYIHNKSLWFRNVGHVKTHQELQWFL